MLRLIVRRILIVIPVVVGATLAVFLLIDRMPGDPAVALAGENPDPNRVQYMREQLGLDKPVVARWWDWLTSAMSGDLGTSLRTQQPVSELLVDRFGVTLSLLTVALAFGALVAFGLGVAGALRPKGFVDRAVTASASLGLAIPSFWLGMLLVRALAVDRRLFPAVGYTPLGDGAWPWFEHLILPAVALGMFLAAELSLQLKAALTDALDSDYVFAARAKGISRAKVTLKHALKNAGVPVATVAGARAAVLIGGTATVESVFALRGIGDLAVGATLNRDVPVMIGVLLVTTVVVQLINLIVDISYGYFNPKARV